MIFLVLLMVEISTTYTVSPGESIQNALDQASSQDTVLLLPGTYSGTGTHLGVIDGEQDGITLLGSAQNSSTVVLDGQNLDQCILLIDGDSNGPVTQATVIRGITFRNGSSGSSPFGGGIYMDKASPSIDLCRFSNCSADNGGGAYIWKGTPEFTGCHFDSCFSVSSGAGLYLYNSPASIRNCRFIDCSSTDDGGGIYIYHSDPEIHSCLFKGSWASDDGASIYCYTLSFPDIGFCTFTQCEANYNGAAVYFRVQCGGNIHDNIIVDNLSTGFYEKGGADPTFSHNCVWNNSGGNYGNLPDPTGQNGNIEQDPLMTGDWYLSSIAAGQPIQSPCIDAASMDVLDAGLEVYWTRTDSVFDSGTADMGYHHGPSENWVGLFERHESATGITVFPNPCSGQLSINGHGRTIRAVRIFDLSGRVIDSQIDLENESVDLFLGSGIIPGVYIASGFVEGKWISTTFLILE
ncbi:MAG: T9SS type A sorting domain-containing protein [Candidatus Aegiribacteria sp.]|nr:T9SS type A sorting domain-containing protein [Candidatus Aegiribacteria sp.]